MRVLQPALLPLARAQLCACLIASSALAIEPVPAVVPTEQNNTPPLGGGRSIVLEPAPPAAARSPRRVFVCTGAGSAVFTDLPCDTPTVSPAIERTPSGPGQSPSVTAPSSRASTRPRILPAPQFDGGPVSTMPARCIALHEQVRAIDARMRDGDSARDAARLWRRWQEASARLSAGRC